jgi:hypothetical protein
MNFFWSRMIHRFVMFLVLSSYGLIDVVSAEGEVELLMEELVTPIVEKVVETGVKMFGEKIKGKKEAKRSKATEEKLTALKKVFFGELEDRVAQLHSNIPSVLQSSDARTILKEQLDFLKSPFQPQIVFPGFSLARGLTSTIYHNLFMYVKRAQQACLDDLEQLILQKQAPAHEVFIGMIQRFKDRIAQESSYLVDNVVVPIDPKKEGIIAPPTIKVVRKQLGSPKTMFDEIVEGSVVALKSSIQSTGQGKYLAQEAGSLKAIRSKASSDDRSQFLVERYGRWIGLKGADGYVGVTSTTKEVTCSFQKFAPETRWVLEGQELGSVVLKNEKTGLVLTVENNAAIGATSKITPDASFECEVLGRPWNPPAYSLPLLKQLPAGTKVAFKVKGQENYLSLDNKGFITASGKSSNDWRSQFYVMRFGNYVGFKLNGWKNICTDPVSQMVYVAQRSHMLYSTTEQWVIDADDKSDLKSVRLINRATAGYLCLPKENWAEGKAATAQVRTPNPIQLISSLATLPDYIAQAATKEQALTLEIEIIKPAPRDIIAGEKSLSFLPAIHGKDTLLWSQNWKFQPGQLSLILSNVQAQAGILIALSDDDIKTKNTVYILIGDQQNSRSGIRVFGSMAASVTQPQNHDAIITAPQGEVLWVTLQDAIISFGKGNVPGARQIASVQLEASVSKKLSYFGLGGGGNPVSFGSISY